MNRRVFALLIAAVMFLPAAVLVSSDDGSDALPPTTFKGIVKDGSKAVPNAKVTIAWKGLYEEATTGTDGKFTIVINEDSSIDPGSATVACEYGVYLKKSDFELTEFETTTPGTYDLEGLTWQDIFIIQPVTVFGFIYSEGKPVDGATVTLETSDENDRVTSSLISKTKADGKYEFRCLPGEYTLRIERSGFEEVPPQNVSVNAAMRINDIHLVLLNEKTYWGLDLAHVFMAVGLIIAGVSLLLIWAYAIYLRKHPEKSRLIDDSLDD